MEEMMVMMMNHESSSLNTHQNNHNIKSLNIPTTTPPTLPTWKLYENPFYNSPEKPPRINHRNKQLVFTPNQDQDSTDHHHKQVHRLHLPIPTRKIAASFWDLTFIKPLMESDLERARAQIDELKAELEHERRSRKRMESANKKLSRELSEERQCREALERVCDELANKISHEKTETNRIKKEIEEERKMLRTAEVIREERVQMKLAAAKMLMEEKFSEIESAKTLSSSSSIVSSVSQKVETKGTNDQEQHSNLSTGNSSHSNSMAVVNIQRRASPEAENPHIKRGIKGFVEFPRVVRTIGCRSSKHVGSKLECQKAQLRILLKQRSTVRFNNGLITS